MTWVFQEGKRKPARLRFEGVSTCIAVFGIILGSAGVSFAGWKDDIGFNQLADVLNSNLPLGDGVSVSLVEAPDTNGDFFPDTSDAEFTAGGDPFGSAVNWINGSGVGIPDPADSSNHATRLAGRYFFGNFFSLAPGANDVTVFEANDYIDNVLGVAGDAVPQTPGYVVQNHSWVGSGDTLDEELSTLRRFDYVIENYDVTMTVGLNNNCNSGVQGDCVNGSPDPNKSHPVLLSHTYNAIAVGDTNGTHSRGLSSGIYGADRYRPDIVVPRITTSEATAVVGSAAALLHDALSGTNGTRSEPIRAILLAGATKDEFANYIEGASGTLNPWARTATHPLDDVFGAGELNVFNSYLMTLGGQYQGSTGTPTSVGSHGWDYQPTITPGSDILYDFVVPQGSRAPELSIVLAWNVEVIDTDPDSLFLPEDQPLANFDLEFVDSFGNTIDESISTSYSLEHIYLTDLAPGTYTLKVSSDVARDYGLAWRMSTLFDTPSADFDGNSIVDGTDFLIWQENFGTLLGASTSMGDADGDGDVDENDFAVFTSTYGVINTAMLAASIAIPEPTSLALFSTGVISLHLLHRSRRKAT